MSGESLTPIVEALNSTITGSQVIELFATGVTVALPLILVWFGCKWVYRRFTNAVKGGRG